MDDGGIAVAECVGAKLQTFCAIGGIGEAPIGKFGIAIGI